MKSREARLAVMLPARLRIAGAWSDVRIRNISSRGMLLEVADPPLPGCYVEVSRGRDRYTASVAWTEGTLCGVQVQERIEIAALTGAPSPRPKATMKRSKSAAISTGRGKGRAFPMARLVKLVLVCLGVASVGARRRKASSPAG